METTTDALDSELIFYRSIDDPRGMGEKVIGLKWREGLRLRLYVLRGGRSDLTLKPLDNGFEMHESIFSRRWAGKNSFQNLFFSGPNCLLLRPEEHRPYAPSREIGYWLAVIRYTKDGIDRWIESLPFKAAPSRPWIGTKGTDVIGSIPEKYQVDQRLWETWFRTVSKQINFEA